MSKLTLRNRVALVSAVVITSGILLCGIVVTLVARYEGFKGIDRHLRVEADHFFNEWEQHGGPRGHDLAAEPESAREWLSANHPERQAEVSDGQGKIIFRSEYLKSDYLQGQGPGVRTLTQERRQRRFLGVHRDGITLRLTEDLRPVEELTHRVLVAFAAATPLLLGFAVLSGRWVARYALEPIRLMATAAEQITAEQLNGRLPVPEAHDEVRRFALVLNDTFGRLATSFAQAQRFSADASHELKTPLTMLRAGIESLLESPTLNEQVRAEMSELLEQTRRLSSIIESLLLLSRSDAGMLKLDLATIDVSEIVEACVEDARIVGEPKQVSFVVEIPAAQHATADRGRLSQILVNLFDNAIKYNKPGGRVQVSVRQAEGALQINVGNTGPGIVAEHASRIFERFYRVEHSAEVSGSGLGLSLAHELARVHGGDLALVCSERGWTEFALRLRRTGLSG